MPVRVECLCTCFCHCLDCRCHSHAILVCDPAWPPLIVCTAVSQRERRRNPTCVKFNGSMEPPAAACGGSSSNRSEATLLGEPLGTHSRNHQICGRRRRRPLEAAKTHVPRRLSTRAITTALHPFHCRLSLLVCRYPIVWCFAYTVAYRTWRTHIYHPVAAPISQSDARESQDLLGSLGLIPF